MGKKKQKKNTSVPAPPSTATSSGPAPHGMRRCHTTVCRGQAFPNYYFEGDRCFECFLSRVDLPTLDFADADADEPTGGGA